MGFCLQVKQYFEMSSFENYGDVNWPLTAWYNNNNNNNNNNTNNNNDNNNNNNNSNNNNVIYIAPFTMCSRRLEESRKKRWDLSLFLNLSIWSTVRTLLGSPFQRWGPATEKARSPACFLARGTSNVMAKSERRLYLVLWTRDWKYEDK